MRSRHEDRIVRCLSLPHMRQVHAGMPAPAQPCPSSLPENVLKCAKTLFKNKNVGSEVPASKNAACMENAEECKNGVHAFLPGKGKCLSCYATNAKACHMPLLLNHVQRGKDR